MHVAAIVGRVWVFAVGDAFQILQLAVRVGASLAPNFVEQAPGENRRVVDVLPDQVEQLVARGVLQIPACRRMIR